ncbi:MAG TPA: BatA and WFA domain-containing protein [Longimicrobiales bacterium]
MGFLNPLWLLLGAAVAVPLILHLLQRHQGPRVIFPAMRYLQRAEREHARRIKLRQLLLLLLRVAALLFIALAAARPFFRSGGVSHEPTAAVIILDNSMSSSLVQGDRRVLDELKDRALATLARAGSDDRFWLLRAGAPWEPALPGDAVTTAARVRETQATAASADLVASIERARDILAQGAGGRAREIQLLSDLQQSNLRGQSQGADDVALIVWSPERTPVANAAISAIQIGGGLAPRARERSNVAVEIAGDSARDSLNLRLHIANRTAGASIGKPGSTVLIPFPPQPASLVTGWVELDADALRADDRRYFVATIAPPPTVTLTRITPFVRSALAVLTDAGRINATPAGGDILIAPAGAGTEGAGARSVVIIAPENALELPAVNRRLNALGINWRIDNNPAAGELRFAARGNDELERALRDVRMTQTYRLIPAARSAGDSVLLRLSDGSAWAVSGERARGGRFVLIGSPLDTRAGTLPTSLAMIPLIDRATGAWVAPPAPRSEARPGEAVNLPAGATAVINPDGSRDTVVAGVTYYAGTQPGAYQVLRGGAVVAAYVVNPSATESMLRSAGRDRVERALPDWRVRFADSPKEWQDRVFARRLGYEMWRTILAVLLILLMIEGIAAATGFTRAPAVPAQES